MATVPSNSNHNRIAAKLSAVSDQKVIKQLEALAFNVRNRALTAAMTKTLKPVERTAEQLAPKRSGLVKKAITKKIKKYGSGMVLGLVGVDAGLVGQYRGKKHWPNKIFHFLEGGTKPHNEPKLGHRHPGAKAKPMLYPALMRHKPQLLEDFAEKVQAEIDKITRL